MTPYQIFLLVLLPVWPLTLLGLLIAMSKLEQRIERTPARSPKEAGLEPAAGAPREKEVTIVFDGDVVTPNTEPARIQES